MSQTARAALPVRAKWVYKCPYCERKPGISLSQVSGLQTVFCCRWMAAKPTRDDAIFTWNTLVGTAWQDKSRRAS